MSARESLRDSYAEQVRRKAERLLRARQRGDSFWSQLVHVGVLGWMFVLPVIGAAFLGGLLARATGIRSLSVACIVAGVAIGAYVVGRQIKRSIDVDDEDGGPEP